MNKILSRKEHLIEKYAILMPEAAFDKDTNNNDNKLHLFSTHCLGSTRNLCPRLICTKEELFFSI